MVLIKDEQIVITIDSKTPIEDLYEMQQAMMAILETAQFDKIEDKQLSIFYYTKILKNLLPNLRQQETALSSN